MPAAAVQAGWPARGRGPGVFPAASGPQRVFPGERAQVEVLRRWIEKLLPACPERDDLIEVACELAANAVCHTLSGNGGQFAVRITPGHRQVTVAVSDGGAATQPRLVEDPLAEHGRGLRIVHALSAWVNVKGGATGRLVEAALPWPTIANRAAATSA
jgi:anti-sigma regulatory factor (Ser/Thr protein kinase)